MNGVLKKSIALTLALSVLAMPLLAQKAQIAQAAKKAERDVEQDINKMLWMGAGFFFGLLGVGAAYVLEPEPPYGRTTGKSEQYRMAYADAYKRAGKDIQTSAAIKGCIGSAVLYGAWMCCWIVWSPGWLF